MHVEASTALAAGPQVNVLYPVDGAILSSSPSEPHHIVYGGDYSVDVARSGGGPVYARFASPNGTLSLSIGGTFQGCANGQGGTGVIVNVSVSGQHIGWVKYSHLQKIPKTSGAIANGARIGDLATGLPLNNACWTGPHTHVEPNNLTGGTACWVARGLNSAVGTGTVMGVVGGNHTSTANAMCPPGSTTPAATAKPWQGVGKATFLGSDTLGPGQILKKNRYILSGNGLYALILQSDGNLVMYSGKRALWSSRTNGKGADRLVMQGDGNLVLYRGGKAVWSTRTNGKGSSRLVMQGDGNLVIYKKGGGHTWASRTAGHPTYKYFGTDNLSTGMTLKRGQYLRSRDRRYGLLLQSDGNLVLYGPGYHVLWHSRTNGKGADRLVMQGDGNLVLYRGGSAVWSTQTNGQGSSRLVLQRDGNLVVYRITGGATWASGTNGKI